MRRILPAILSLVPTLAMLVLLGWLSRPVSAQAPTQTPAMGIVCYPMGDKSWNKPSGTWEVKTAFTVTNPAYLGAVVWTSYSASAQVIRKSAPTGMNGVDLWGDTSDSTMGLRCMGFTPGDGYPAQYDTAAELCAAVAPGATVGTLGGTGHENWRFAKDVVTKIGFGCYGNTNASMDCEVTGMKACYWKELDPTPTPTQSPTPVQTSTNTPTPTLPPPTATPGPESETCISGTTQSYSNVFTGPMREVQWDSPNSLFPIGPWVAPAGRGKVRISEANTNVVIPALQFKVLSGPALNLQTYDISGQHTVYADIGITNPIWLTNQNLSFLIANHPGAGDSTVELCIASDASNTCDGHLQDGDMEQYPTSQYWEVVRDGFFGRFRAGWPAWLFPNDQAYCGSGFQRIGNYIDMADTQKEAVPIKQTFCWPDSAQDMWLSFDYAILNHAHGDDIITYTIRDENNEVITTDTAMYNGNGNDYQKYQKQISGQLFHQGNYTIDFALFNQYALQQSDRREHVKLDNVQIMRGMQPPDGWGTCNPGKEYTHPTPSVPLCDAYDLLGMSSCSFNDEIGAVDQSGYLTFYDGWGINGPAVRTCQDIDTGNGTQKFCSVSLRHGSSMTANLSYYDATHPADCSYGTPLDDSDKPQMWIAINGSLSGGKVIVINRDTNQHYDFTPSGGNYIKFNPPSGNYKVQIIAESNDILVDDVAVSKGWMQSRYYPQDYPDKFLVCSETDAGNSPTNTPMPTQTEGGSTATPIPTNTPVNTPSSTPTQYGTPFITYTPPTPTPSETPTPFPTLTPFPTWTERPSKTPKNTNTPTLTPQGGPPSDTPETPNPPNTATATNQDTPTGTITPAVPTNTLEPTLTSTKPLTDTFNTPTYVPPEPPQQPPPDCYAACNRPTAPDFDTPYDNESGILAQLQRFWYLIKYTAGWCVSYLGGWVDYGKCSSLSFIVWCPEHTEQIAALPTAFANREPFGTINEVNGAVQALSTVYNAYNWANSGVTINGQQVVSDSQVNYQTFFQVAENSPYNGGQIDILGQSGSSISGESTTQCEFGLKPYVGPLLSAGMCFSISTADRLGVLAWMQVCVNGLSVLILITYIMRRWINAGMGQG